MKKVNSRNYYGKEANREFMSASQYKSFAKCEAAAMAELKGEYERPKSNALLLGSYVDEMLTGTKRSREKFLAEHPELFVSRGDRKGQLKAEFINADDVIKKIKKQPLMMHYLSGRHQKIMTGVIAGVPFKIKMDSYKPGEFIADLKYMASLRSPNLFESMVKYWGYDIAAAIYQEVVYQNTGKRLPFYLVIATKESPTHLEVCEIKQYDLDDALEQVKKNAPRYQAIKLGEIEPERCEDYNCDYCTESRIITEVIDSNMLGMARKL